MFDSSDVIKCFRRNKARIVFPFQLFHFSARQREPVVTRVRAKVFYFTNRSARNLSEIFPRHARRC